MVKDNYSEPQSDAGKPKDKKKRLGQVFTPESIANQMVKELSTLVTCWDKAKILDPCIGEAELPKALVRAGITGFDFLSYEIDPELANTANEWLKSSPLSSRKLVCEDFLLAGFEALPKWDVVIANPPYIRQEWIEKKQEYQKITKSLCNSDVPGSSNLYIYFIVKIIMGLKDGGAFSVIVYDSWVHTRYGKWLVNFLNDHCVSLRSIPVRNTPFNGHLIDATILVGKRAKSKRNQEVFFTVDTRSSYANYDGFVKIENEYWTKRGLRLKQASFFMAGYDDIAANNATPFVKKPSNLSGMSVCEDHSESALLIPTKGDKDKKVYAELNRRLSLASQFPEKNQSILNWYEKKQEHWDRHPEPPRAQILFNYYIRSRPRHIFNPNNYFYADNFYGVVPKNALPVASAFALLNSSVVVHELLSNSRTQGNGLYKLQLFEYREAWLPSSSALSKQHISRLGFLGEMLASKTKIDQVVIEEIDKVIFEAFGYNPKLEPNFLLEKIKSFWNKN